MDEIQRSLRASLEAGPGAAAREEFFRNLPKDPDALSFRCRMGIKRARSAGFCLHEMPLKRLNVFDNRLQISTTESSTYFETFLLLIYRSEAYMI